LVLFIISGEGWIISVNLCFDRLSILLSTPTLRASSPAREKDSCPPFGGGVTEGGRRRTYKFRYNSIHPPPKRGLPPKRDILDNYKKGSVNVLSLLYIKFFISATEYNNDYTLFV
jgi:hypothetical protein